MWVTEGESGEYQGVGHMLQSLSASLSCQSTGSISCSNICLTLTQAPETLVNS